MGSPLTPEEVKGVPLPGGGTGNGAQMQQLHPGYQY
jgi:hypothetical protein